MPDMLVSHSPQQPDLVVAEAAATTPSQVVEAVARAREAARHWSATGGPGRCNALRQVSRALAARSQELEDLIVTEVGKPRGEARGEVARTLAIVDYYAQAALLRVGEVLPPNGTDLLYTERRPHGVVGLITPWNFPAAIPFWKAMPALAAGNAVLLKPSTAALGCARFLADLVAAHLPEGTVELVPGERETATAMIDLVDAVSFTGSTAVGRSVARRAAGRGIPVQAEMGGQNAAIVLPDAPIEATAVMLAGAAMGYAGQKCTATSRVVVVGDPAPLLEALEAAVKSLPVGDPGDERTVAGPVISSAAAAAVEDAAARVTRDGGLLVRGSGVDSAGHFVAPTLLWGLSASHPLNQEETFGPITSVLPVESAQEAVAVANAVAQGLVSSVHGRDVGRLMSVVRGLDTGMIKVNAPSSGVDFYAPFGGEKDSSVGPREQGATALEFYTSSRTVTIASPGGSG
ncbi:aldehyde dehydrogenase family protein [Actinoallomurus acaciae]|uniref:Aldehyde dehydrogenase family protein n=1 Tax=Actinoallomurus acaciae TaxID=502577 RepID=A0ABV5YDV1_9ACTN